LQGVSASGETGKRASLGKRFLGASSAAKSSRNKARSRGVAFFERDAQEMANARRPT
jgi:hypothetical protein